MITLSAVRALVSLLLFCAGAGSLPNPEKLSLDEGKRILFLGDSITDAGLYVAFVELELRLQRKHKIPELINLGLPSETCSGLSEPGHPFPRPNIHERIERALARVDPDLVVICYGINDGLYSPWSEERFATYCQGITRLLEKVHLHGAKPILMTGTPFDPLPLRDLGRLRSADSKNHGSSSPYREYDTVMHRYAEWIMLQGEHVEMVIDLHSSVNRHLAYKRQTSPAFTLSEDGIHLNDEGHRVLANTILKDWGFDGISEDKPELLALVVQRQKILHDAWLSHVGHNRPGVPVGPPLTEAHRRAQELHEIMVRMSSPSCLK